MIRQPFGKAVWHCTVLTHRWLGIGTGFLVLLWCLSGIVMMYQRYPEMQRGEELAGLAVLDLQRCCVSPDANAGLTPVSSYRLEMLLGRPVLRYTGEAMGGTLDLATGRSLSTWSAEELVTAGRAYAERRSWAAAVDVAEVLRDQWTVQGSYDRHRPMLKLANAEGRNWYVSGTTAEIVQVTGRAERFWNWLGSIPHWLYPTELRRHPALWAQVVIWLSIIGLFLTATGIAIGIVRYRSAPAGRASPYGGWWYWHHCAGLCFGLFTLTWLFSGLMSMNPWGTLESRSFATERAIVNGVNASLGEVVADLRRVAAAIPDRTVRLESAYWLGRTHWLAYDRDGAAARLSKEGRSGALSVADGAAAASALGIDATAVAWLSSGDTYYYAHHDDVELPAIRISAATGDRYYIGAASGRLHRISDRSDRRARWLFRGLHRGDFTAALRSRPTWDLVLIVLLVGCTAGAATGTWLGFRRLAGSPRPGRGDG